jgi:S-adenosylmethionine synthetase
VEKIGAKPVCEQSIEMVERKGVGHPDYIADAVSEGLSLELCRYYLKNFKTIFHHNVDKGLVVGGKANPYFGGGEVEEPIRIIIAGRAVTQIKTRSGTVEVPIDRLVNKTVEDFIKKKFRFLNPKKHVKIEGLVREGSVDLVGLFQIKRRTPLSNDTSFGVCFAPLTPTEKLVLRTEKFLNSEKFKKTLPEVGEDIKVMGLRVKNDIKLTISAAVISKLTKDKSHYMNVKEEVKRKVEDFASKIVGDLNVTVDVNVGDKPQAGIFYLTVTGTSAERGDDGNTGRGNRVNGLITPCRHMSLEATAGKNPVNHVGKIYNVLAKIAAEKIVKEVKGIREVYVKILSQIGKPINKPLMANVQLLLEKGYSLTNIRADIKSIIDEEIANVGRITDLILKGKVELF